MIGSRSSLNFANQASGAISSGGGNAVSGSISLSFFASAADPGAGISGAFNEQSIGNTCKVIGIVAGQR